MDETHGNSGRLPESSGTSEDTSIAGSPLQPEGPALTKRRLGFMDGQFTVPDDIKTMFAEEIEEMFYGYRAQHKFDDVEEAIAMRLRQEPEAKS